VVETDPHLSHEPYGVPKVLTLLSPYDIRFVDAANHPINFNIRQAATGE
jgi:hypothetical protein